MITILLQVVWDNPALYTYGPLGIFCAYFMWRDVARDRERASFMETIKDVGHRIDGLTKTLLVDMVNKENVGPKTKQYAVEAIAKIDARDTADSKVSRAQG